MRKDFWNLILWAAFITGGLLQIMVLLAVYEKGGGTTGGEPYNLIILSAVPFLLGLYARLRRGGVSNRVLSSVALTVGLFGCALPYWLEHTGSLVQYERWLRNNQSPNAENLGLCLLLFAGAEALALIGVTLWGSRKLAATGEI